MNVGFSARKLLSIRNHGIIQIRSAAGLTITLSNRKRQERYILTVGGTLVFTGGIGDHSGDWHLQKVHHRYRLLAGGVPGSQLHKLMDDIYN